MCFCMCHIGKCVEDGDSLWVHSLVAIRLVFLRQVSPWPGSSVSWHCGVTRLCRVSFSRRFGECNSGSHACSSTWLPELTHQLTQGRHPIVWVQCNHCHWSSFCFFFSNVLFWKTKTKKTNQKKCFCIDVISHISLFKTSRNRITRILS